MPFPILSLVGVLFSKKSCSVEKRCKVIFHMLFLLISPKLFSLSYTHNPEKKYGRKKMHGFFLEVLFCGYEDFFSPSPFIVVFHQE